MELLDLLKGTGDPAFALDAGGRIVGWNRPAERLFGCKARAALGHPCHQVLRCRDPWGSDAHPEECPVVRAAREGRGAPPGGVLLARRAGSDREVLRLARSAITHPGSARAQVVVLLHPAPGGALASDPAAERRALPGPDLAPFLDQVLALTGADAVELFLTDPAGRARLVMAAHRGLFPRAFLQMTEFAYGQGFPGLVARTGRPLLCGDLAGDPRYLRSEVKRRGFRSYLCVPLRGVTGFLGVLNLVSRQGIERTGPHLQLLGHLAGELAEVVELGRLRATERLAAGLALGGAGESMEEAAALVLSTLMEASGADAGAVVVETDDGPRAVAARGLSPRRRELLARACGRDRCSLARDGGALTARPAAGRAGSGDPPCLRAERVWARMACLPLEAGSRRVGSVVLGYRGRDPIPGHRFVYLHGVVRWAGALLEERMRRTGGARPARGRARGSTPEAAAEVTWPNPPGRNGSPVLDLRCLGPFRVFVGGRAVPPSRFTRRRSLLLLKILLTRYGKPVHRDELIELLVPGGDPRTGGRLLNVAVHYLRRALEEAGNGRSGPGPIVREGETYLFDPAFPHRIDVQEFLEADRLSAELESAGETGGALAAVRNAESLYRGDLFEDEPYGDWCAMEREYLRHVFMGILQRGARLHAARGEVDQAAACLRRALCQDETLEEVHRALMQLLWSAGRREEALRQYERCRAVLNRELRVAPSTETERLRLQILSDPLPLALRSVP